MLSPNVDERVFAMSKSKLSVIFVLCGLMTTTLVGCQQTLITPQVAGNSVGNVMNFGRVAQQGDWIYYSNSSDDWAIYKIRTDGTEKTKLLSANILGLSGISVMDEWLYFQLMDDESALFRAEINGQTISTIRQHITMYFLYEDWIYCADTWGVNRVSKDGEHETELFSYGETRAPVLAVYNGFIFYNEGDRGLYRRDLDGKYPTEIVPTPFSRFVVDRNWVYYTVEWQLYKVTVNGENNTSLGADKVGFLNVADGWIYYSNHSDGGKLYKMRIDATQKTKLTDDEACDINIIDQWVYYRNNTDLGDLYRIRKDGTERQRVD